MHVIFSIRWSILIMLVTLAPGKAIPKVGIIQVDKFVHFFLFVVWMILTSSSILKIRYLKSEARYALILTGLCGLGIGVMTECIQYYVTGRSFSLPDMLANATGVFSGYLIAWLFSKWKTI